ncbi:hypothetical protein [Winogradskyella luteola]|uniref:Uncharacterized protein n=1 Tax=Winogradskyella luteola TaxID=2828330 RepID=A0A9X1F714_9FLAO|nr:hypothetical protein [Winogradskyella luteola]MBV7268409.1 hypothetical protein [Winogradskyella luteola]
MYTKKFIPLTETQIKMVNASGLAKKFECSHSYVSRILKSESDPENDKAQNILKAAREIIEYYESINVEQ